MNRTDEISLGLAGMIRDDGHLADTPFRLVDTLVPDVIRLDGATVSYQMVGPDNDTGVPRLRTDPAGALDLFRRIRDGRDVLAFAQRYGVLALCDRHGWPTRHPPLVAGPKRCKDPDLYAWTGWNMPPAGGSPPWHESIEHWLYWVGKARALLELPAFAHAKLDEEHGPSKGFDQFERTFLQTVYWWMTLGDVRPVLLGIGRRDKTQGPEMRLAGTTFGLLGVQMIGAITRTHGTATCGICGGIYLPQRRPQRGRVNYCGDAACVREGARRRKRLQLDGK